jgi:Tfp pilus assembly protein PilN
VLRSNLSTRPFYNERIVHLLVALGAVIVLTITLFDVGKIVNLSRHNTEVSGWIARDRQETARLTSEAARIRGGIDQKGLAIVAASAREANLLIDQRTFSWTAFFNQVEAALPPDVMLVSVRPSQERDATKLSMLVLGRTAEDIDEFIEKLEASGAFEQILARQTDKTEDGLNRAVLEAVYVPGHAEAAPANEAVPAAAAPAAAVPAAAAPAAAAPGASKPAASNPAGGVKR